MSEQVGSLPDLLSRMGLGSVDRRVVALVAAAGIVLVAALFIGFRGESEQAFELARPLSTETTMPAAQEVQPAAETTLVVHVAGAVLRPGLVFMPGESRVGNAIDAAGGPLGSASLDALNLARILSDGEQIYVPDVDEVNLDGAPTPAGAPASGQDTVAGRLDLNSADVMALDTLPGVGPSTAAKIIADRESNGPFASVDDLQRVSGIGPKRIEELRALVEVR